jgi:hypothetical protein
MINSLSSLLVNIFALVITNVYSDMWKHKWDNIHRENFHLQFILYIVKRNLGVKCGRRVGLTTLPPSISRLSK